MMEQHLTDELAAAIQAAHQYIDGGTTCPRTITNIITNRMMWVLRADNPDFDWDRFAARCTRHREEDKS